MTKRITIIAEAGVNYNGDITIAKEMVKAAAASGADYVKFQTGVPKFDVSVFAEKAEYQKTNTGDASGAESQLEMCSKLMLPFEVYPELIACCEENHIRFLSSPFDPPCAAFLHDMGMHLWKIPSGEITHFPMLKLIASYGEPVIMSTGMATMEEIENNPQLSPKKRGRRYYSPALQFGVSDALSGRQYPRYVCPEGKIRA